MDIVRLCQDIDAAGISLHELTTESIVSVSVPGHIAVDTAKCRNTAQLVTCLAHECGHCVTGSFYNVYSPLDIRQKHENTADKWAIEHTITADELDDAIAEGCGEYWQLAERFGVTTEFVRKAVCWYTYGNLAADQFL